MHRTNTSAHQKSIKSWLRWARDSADQRFENQENSAKNLPTKTHLKKQKQKHTKRRGPQQQKANWSLPNTQQKTHISNSQSKRRPKGPRKNKKRGIAIQKITASPPECVWKLSRIFDQKSIKARCEIWYVFDMCLRDCSLIFGCFLDQQWSFLDKFSERAILWKIATRLYENTISGFGGSGNRSNIDLKTVSKITFIFGSIFDGVGADSGGFSAPKIAISFVINFWKALKSIRDQKQSSSVAQAPPLRTPKVS